MARFEEARQRLVAARLYVISADAEPADQARALCAAIDGGATVVQLRNKVAGAADLLEAARAVANHATARGAVFIVNDEPELAAAAGADGVHLGQGDGDIGAARRHLPQGAIFGRSTHSLEQARAAEAEGADYIGVGPIHATPTKPGRAPVGLELPQVVAPVVHIPWFAIGGLNVDNVADVVAAGAGRIAVVRAVTAAADPRAAAQGLLAALAAGVPA